MGDLLAVLEITEEDVDPFRAKAEQLMSTFHEPLSEEEVSLPERIAEIKRDVERHTEGTVGRCELERDIFQLEFTAEKLRSDRILRDLTKSLERLQEGRESDLRTKESSAAGTTFRPLGKALTAKLLAHGYLSGMANCQLFLDFPRPEKVPPQEEFERLAQGLLRKK